MQKETVVRIITEIKANYRYTYRDMTKEEMRLMVERWFDCLKPFSDNDVESAFRVALCKFSMPPTIADIIGIISRQERLKQPTDAELWSQLMKAVKQTKYEIYFEKDIRTHYAYQLKTKEVRDIYASLDEMIRAYIDFDGFCEYGAWDEIQLQIERSRFLKALPEIREAFAEKKLAQMREPVKERIESTQKPLIGVGGKYGT